MGSQLRSFSAYDKTAGQSLFTVACRLVNIDGNYPAGPGGEFFQIFDKASVPVANDVPLRSFYLPAGPVNLPSVFQTLGPLTLALGLAVGISSVNEKYTASASAYDVFGDVEEFELPGTGLTTAGDLTTQVGSLDVLSTPQSPFVRVYEVLFTAPSGNAYWQVYSSGGTYSVLLAHGPLVLGVTRRVNFGCFGLPTNRTGSDGSDQSGLWVGVSDTAMTYTTSGKTSAIQVKYKNITTL